MSQDLVPWLILAVVVGGVLAFDLLVLHRNAKPVSIRQAAAWSAVWVSLALSYGVYVALVRGGEAGPEYLAGYLIELSLSVDNVFVFAIIFATFGVPAAYQHRLLFWGILGAVVFRAVFIAAGAAILDAAHWMIYVLGFLLVVTGIRFARSSGHAIAPERNPVLRVFRRFVPMTDGFRGPAFVVREGGRRLATPLLAVLVTIETTDIMFALDSIPAVFAVTTDPLIVFSSNLFAILGLRSLYFLLAGLLDRFVYLKLGLAALLIFAGAKILVSPIYEVPIVVTLAVIVSILGGAIGSSLIATHPRRGELRMPAVRVASGVALGLGGVTFFALVAAARDGSLWPAITPPAGLGLDRLSGGQWVLLEVALLAAVGSVVVAMLVALRRRHVRPALVGGWATLGALILALVAFVILLD